MSTDARLPRLLALLPWLRAHPGVPVAEAAAAFGVTERQLRQDLELVLFCGLPGLGPGDLIDVELEGDVIRVLDAQTLDRPLRLTGTEGLALVAAARALADVPGLDRDAALERALAKLQDALGEAADEEVRRPALEVALTTGEEDPEVVAAVRQAVASGRRLALRYHVERRDELTDREVDPVRLDLTEGRLYLQAHDRDREAMRTFRLDRVTSARVLDEPADPPAAAVPADLAQGVFRPRPEDLAVVLHLAPAARWVADYHPCEVVEEAGGGALRVVLRTPDPGWVVRLVLRLGGSGRVLEPPQVVEQVREAAAAALAAYPSHPAA